MCLSILINRSLLCFRPVDRVAFRLLLSQRCARVNISPPLMSLLRKQDRGDLKEENPYLLCPRPELSLEFPGIHPPYLVLKLFKHWLILLFLVSIRQIAKRSVCII
jgi:hypothetical protein